MTTDRPYYYTFRPIAGWDLIARIGPFDTWLHLILDPGYMAEAERGALDLQTV